MYLERIHTETNQIPKYLTRILMPAKMNHLYVGESEIVWRGSVYALKAKPSFVLNNKISDYPLVCLW